MDGQSCPYGYHSDGGQCIADYKSFREWSEETKIGIFIPNKSSDQVTYDEFMEIVKEVVSDYRIMSDLRDDYCRQFENGY